MKFLQLNLKAFGPFTERRLDLDENPGMHLFHGPNEAGKSSMLRAISYMLFGFDRSTSDNYLHDNKELRVGGTLRRSDGQCLEFLRRKGNKNTLISPEGGALHDDALAPFLGGVDQDLFARLYGLNHETLVQGGRALLQDDGDVGQSLLSASMGPGLRTIVENLRQEAGVLWKARGQKYQVNAAIQELKEARNRISKATLLPQTWTNTVRELEKIEQDIAALADRKLQLDTELHRLERQQKAIPKVLRYRELKACRSALPETPELADSFREKRTTQQALLAQLEEQLKAADQKLARLSQELEETPHHPEILQCQGRIESQVKQIENYRASETQLSQLTAKTNQLEAQADNLAADLKPGATRETLALPHAALRQQVSELAQQYRQSRGILRKSREDLSLLKTELQTIEAELEPLGPAIDLGPLEKVESLLHQHLPLDERIAELQAKIDRQQDLVSEGCAQLPLWEGTACALRDLSLPLAETISEFESRFLRLQHERESLDKLIALSRTELATLKREVLHLQGRETLPTLPELQQCRQQRQSLWQELASAMNRGTPLAKDQLAAYDALVQKSDSLADRMFEAAEQVTKMANIERQREALSEKLQNQLNQQEAQVAEHKRLRQAWRKWWLPLGREPLSPKEMRGWLERRQRILEGLQQTEQGCRELKELMDQRTALLARARAALIRHSGDSDPQPSSLAEAQRRLRAALEPQKLAAATRERLQRDRLRVEQAIQKASAACQTAEIAAEKERKDWGEAVDQLSADPTLEPSELGSLLASFEELRKCKERLSELSTQIQFCREQKERFEQSTEEIAQQLGLQADESDAAAIIERLSLRLQTAKRHQQTRLHLTRERTTLEREKQNLKERIARTNTELEQMRLEAGASSLEELPEIEQRARQLREIDQQLKNLEAGLRELSAGQALDLFCREVEAVDADRIPSLIEDKRAALEKLAADRDDLRVRQGELQREQRQSDGAADAAEAAADAQEALARTRNGVERYMVLSLAEHLLSQEIERYRVSHQGPLIKIASQSFAKLTLGIYSGLEIGFDEKDKPILQACEANKRKVEINGLSDGTRDQLFLALRLAAIEHGLQHREPVPFVADDLLVHFDQERAAAALELLADFAQKTQVLFFTHLDRDRDLALSVLGDRVKVHQLERALSN